MSAAISTISSSTRAGWEGSDTAARPGGRGRPELRLPRFLADSRMRLADRVSRFARFIEGEYQRDLLVAREIVSPMGREVYVRDPRTGIARPMLMFGSNNYLGLVNDPLVTERVKQAASRWGAGVAGPPMLNGTTSLHRSLEHRLSRLKCTEAALLYSSGYGANVGWISGLVGRRDVVVLDERSHASAFDGIKHTKARAVTFRHNDVADLRARLAEIASSDKCANVFVLVEGVYSMDGDLAPLDEIVPLCRRFDAFLVVDDAHGTGVLGDNGGGAAEHFGLQGEVDLAMGTFSKAFAITGGFLAGRKEVIDFLRFFSRPYFFSASLPPMAVAAVLAGLDILARQPERRARLHENVRYLVGALCSLGIDCRSESAIVPVRVPAGKSIRRLGRRFDDAGIFLNAIEYPAVAAGEERFRVSVSSEHTRSDLDRLVSLFAEIWREEGIL